MMLSTKSIQNIVLVSLVYKLLYAFLPCDAEYCENLEQKGNEWLPLGPKHQQHTNCFIEYAI